MIGRVVEIAEEGRHLSVYRGFLKVAADGKELGRVPLDDIAALIVNAHARRIERNLPKWGKVNILTFTDTGSMKTSSPFGARPRPRLEQIQISSSFSDGGARFSRLQ